MIPLGLSLHVTPLHVALERNVDRDVVRLQHRGQATWDESNVCAELPEEAHHVVPALALGLRGQGAGVSRFVIRLRQEKNFILSQIGNADQTSLCLDMPRNTTCTEVCTVPQAHHTAECIQAWRKEQFPCPGADFPTRTSKRVQPRYSFPRTSFDTRPWPLSPKRRPGAADKRRQRPQAYPSLS